MSERIIRQVTLTKGSRRADKSVAITFITDLEESPEGLMEIDKLLGSRGVIHFSDRGTLTQDEVDMLDSIDIELEGKTQSQRLRNTLHVYHTQYGSGDFKAFYKSETERIIQHYKDQLK